MMKKLLMLVTAVLFFATASCGGDEFSATPSAGGNAGTGGSAGKAGSGGTGKDAGHDADSSTGGSGGSTGGSAGTGGNTGGTGGSTGGSAGDGGTGGTSTGGSGGSTGGSASSTGGSGGSNPCPNITYDAVAALASQPCASLFASGCGTSDPVARGEFMAVAMSLVPAAKLQGYTAPTVASFSDVPVGNPAFAAVEKAVWLEVISVTPFFQPAGSTTTCYAEGVITKVQALPAIYAVVFSNQASGPLATTSGPSTTTRMHLYGTSTTNHLTQMVRVVNNLAADFTVPQATTGLEAVVIRCEIPPGSSYTSYPLPLDGSGKAEFATLDCFSQSGGMIELQLQMDPSPSGAGQQARIGIDPGTLPVRGGQANAPTKTIN